MKRFELKVERDDDPMNPRTEWDNITTMICVGKYSYLGDKHNYKSSDFDSWEELKEQIESDYKVLSIKPLYVYDHSGITISTSSFSCQWDTSRIGWVFIHEKQLNSMCGEDFERGEEKLSLILDGEVKTYDEYLTGEVYKFEVYEIETCDKGHEHKVLLESCGSYYDEGDCRDEGQSVLQSYSERELVSE
jgi:hypothetical protein